VAWFILIILSIVLTWMVYSWIQFIAK
jgi:hypothetical protein